MGVVRPAMESLEPVVRVEESAGRDGTIRLTAFPRQDASILANVSQLVQAHGWAVRDIRPESGNLEDVFRRITTGGAEPDSAPPILIPPPPATEVRPHA